MGDPTIRRLTKKIFPYLWFRHKLVSSVPSTGIFPFSEMTVFAQGIGNAVIVYLHMYRPALSKFLEKHIPSMPQSKMHFWAHIAFLCLHVRLTNDNVFDYFLTTCAITAEVALHCYMNGYNDVLSLAPTFFCAFFENELYEGFHKAGSWKRLHQYIENTSCKELYELVDGYIKKILSPSDPLPILISIKREELAAERREKFMSLLSIKIGEVEREDQTSTLVSGICHWYFMENHRISENKPGILKRHKNNKSKVSMDELKHNESSESDEILDSDGNISNVIDPFHNETQPSESIYAMSKTRFHNKAVQTLDDSRCTEKRQESRQLCTNNETPEQTKFSSSRSLRELCNFYESLSASPKRKIDDLKYFRSYNGMRKGPKLSAIKELSNRSKKVNSFEKYQRSVPNSSENGEDFPESKDFTPGNMNKTTTRKTFYIDDVQSEFTKSFQELGFRCYCVGDSTPFDEKFANFPNHAKVMEKCNYFRNRHPSIQFAILIPNDRFGSGTETSNNIISNKEQFSIFTKDLNKSVISPEKFHSEIGETTFKATKLDKNQFGLDNGQELLQKLATENTQKSRFEVTKVEESDLLIGQTSRTKIKETRTILKDETTLSGKKCVSELTTESRFIVTNVNESQLDGKNAFEKNWINESNKISRFTVTKVKENPSTDLPSKLGKKLSNETTKISRFTVTKVDENQSRNEANIPGRNWTTVKTKISRFTVTKVNENESRDGVSILRNWTNETTKTSRFTVTKVDENQSKGKANILKNRTTKISRFTVTKVNENESRNEASILRRNWTNKTTQISRFTVGRVDENEPKSRAEMCSMRKSYPTTTTKVSRFAVTRVGDDQTSISEQNFSISSEISVDTENGMMHFQDNYNAQYQKRVSFAEHPSISYYQAYSSDESYNNSINSRESLKNFPEDVPSSRNSEPTVNQEGTLSPPSLRNSTVSERRRFFERFMSGENQSSSENAGNSNMSLGFGFFNRIFRRSTSSISQVESPKKEMDKQRIEELRKSLEALRARNPAVFKV